MGNFTDTRTQSIYSTDNIKTNEPVNRQIVLEHSGRWRLEQHETLNPFLIENPNEANNDFTCVV